MELVHGQMLPMKMESAFTPAKAAAEISGLWTNMLKGLAEGLGRFQEKDSPPLFGFDPQPGQQWKSSIPSLWISGIRKANPQTPVALMESSCWQAGAETINPGIRRPTTYIRLSLNKTL